MAGAGGWRGGGGGGGGGGAMLMVCQLWKGTTRQKQVSGRALEYRHGLHSGYFAEELHSGLQPSPLFPVFSPLHPPV